MPHDLRASAHVDDLTRHLHTPQHTVTQQSLYRHPLTHPIELVQHDTHFKGADPLSRAYE